MKKFIKVIDNSYKVPHVQKKFLPVADNSYKVPLVQKKFLPPVAVATAVAYAKAPHTYRKKFQKCVKGYPTGGSFCNRSLALPEGQQLLPIIIVPTPTVASASVASASAYAFGNLDNCELTVQPIRKPNIVIPSIPLPVIEKTPEPLTDRQKKIQEFIKNNFSR